MQALRSLLGEGYVLHPHGGVHAKPPGSVGQSFHKDGFFPGGGHGIRYHRPEYLLFIYYPQDTTELMAPTGFVPYSQFATFDHDENMDHWAIEMLDNNFWMSDPLSPLSPSVG